MMLSLFDCFSTLLLLLLLLLPIFDYNLKFRWRCPSCPFCPLSLANLMYNAAVLPSRRLFSNFLASGLVLDEG
jgi:hypothetical protein